MIPEHFKVETVDDTILEQFEEKEISFGVHKYKVVRVLRISPPLYNTGKPDRIQQNLGDRNNL